MAIHKTIKTKRKAAKTTKKVEGKSSAKKTEIENNKKSQPTSTYSNVGDEYREYKKKLNNVSQMLSEIKELNNDRIRSH